MSKKYNEIEKEAKRQLEIEKAKKKLKQKDPDYLIKRGIIGLVLGLVLVVLYYYVIRLDLIGSIGVIMMVIGFIAIFVGGILKLVGKSRPMLNIGKCDFCGKIRLVGKSSEGNICILCKKSRNQK